MWRALPIVGPPSCMTVDGSPISGILLPKPNMYIATGFAKWGMTNSTVSAILLRT